MVNRNESRMLSVAEYWRLREATGFTGPILDLVERLARAEVAQRAFESEPLRAMRKLTIDVVDASQDILSLDKEEAAGDPHNLVLVMEREHHTGREQTVRNIQLAIRKWTDELLLREASLPALCDTLGLTPAENTAVFTLIRGMRTTVRGNYDGCRMSPRYDVEPATNSGGETETAHEPPALRRSVLCPETVWTDSRSEPGPGASAVTSFRAPELPERPSTGAASGRW